MLTYSYRPHYRRGPIRFQGVLAGALLACVGAAAVHADPPAASAPSTTAPAQAPWPASDTVLNYLQQLDQHALNYPVARAAVLGCITTASDDRHADETCRKNRQRFRAQNPAAPIGTYISGGGCRRRAQMRSYPSETVEYELLPPESFTGEINDEVYTVNVADPQTAERFADAIVRAVTGRGCDFVYLDEIRHPSSGGTRIPWEKMTRFLGRVRSGLHAAGMKLVANVAVSPWVLAGHEADLLQEAVDGMCFEMCFEPQWCRTNRERFDAEIAVYRQWLAAGKLVLLIPNYSKDDAVLEDRRFAAGMAMVIRERGQPLFVHCDFWRSMPTWIDWPHKYAVPRGELARTGPTSLKRRFEKGTLVVDTAAGTVRSE
ncbi:MAG TPA: hypothetical protein VGM03_10925 [Phycisphaerae bacterium]